MLSSSLVNLFTRRTLCRVWGCLDPLVEVSDALLQSRLSEFAGLG